MPSKKTPARPSDPDLELVRSLAMVLHDSGLTEIELERKGTRFRVSKAAAAVVHATVPAAANLQHAHHALPVATAVVAEAAKPADHPGAVKSPMVGTVYLASAPGTAAFVELGAEVKEGQTLLIIEAMKTMNQIPAPRAGRVTHIFVENGQPVEFGEALVVIE
jgi:acetyl-CoA carboxylase biotin carboxyl carrier protein